MMPHDWSQRVRQLRDMPSNRATLARLAESAPIPDRFRTRQAPTSSPVPAANPFDVNLPAESNPFGPGYPPVVQHNSGAAQFNLAPPTQSGPAPVVSAPRRPNTVRVASWALLCAAAMTLTLIGIAVGAIFELRDTFDNALKLDKSGTATLVAAGYADDTQTALVVIALFLGVLLAVVYLLVARALWAGRHWPRWVSPFLAVLSLPALLLGHIAILAVIAGIISTVASWMPNARSFATQSRAHAAARRASRRRPFAA